MTKKNEIILLKNKQKKSCLHIKSCERSYNGKRRFLYWCE